MGRIRKDRVTAISDGGEDRKVPSITTGRGESRA